jgi:outer membrane receptor protein involved in Fe transport
MNEGSFIKEVGEAILGTFLAKAFVRRWLAETSFITLAAACVASPSSAQTATGAGANPATATTQVGEVVVTGSRIERSGYETPAPLTVASADRLNSAAPTTLQDALTQLPQFKGLTRSAYPGGANAGGPFGSIGASLLSLRNLGPQRTLVLVDGRRTAPSNVQGSVDVANFPQGLVKNVEIITAGASAVYGSDAVSGVVNFILDTKFEGVKADVQTGISKYHDLPSYGASVTVGRHFLDDRGHFVASADYYYQKGIGVDDPHRPYEAQGPGVITLPAGSVPLRQTFTSNVFVSDSTNGGLINAGPLRGTSFGPGGAVQKFTFGTPLGGLFMHGGSGIPVFVVAAADIDRHTGFARIDYDVTPDLNVFAQVLYGDTRAEFNQSPTRFQSSSPITIFSGNAFLPASVQTQMTSLGLASFTLGRINDDMPPYRANAETTTIEFNLGLKGSIASLGYDAYIQHGESEFDVNYLRNINFQNAYAALDAVRDPATGQIVCRSTLLFGISPGCVPFNPFGSGSPSQAAIAYVTAGTQFRNLTSKQDVAAFNVHGNLFHLWSDDAVAFAAGAEYRKLSANVEVDGAGLQRLNFTNIRGAPPGFDGRFGIYFTPNFQPTQGSYNVWETFGEIDVPVIKDRPFFALVDVDGAVRYTHYSTSGGVTTWKVGLNYKPIDDLRIRITRSEDIRAPNIGELFTTPTNGFLGNVSDPTRGNQPQFVSALVGGNRMLAPERSKNETYGLVYSPSWLPGFRASIDYYDLNITNAITSLSAQQTVNACFQGSATACAAINKTTPTNWIISTTSQNVASIRTNGIDYAAQYRLAFFRGNLDLNASANYTDKYTIKVPAASTIELGGVVSGINAASVGNTPHWSGLLQAQYTQDAWSLFIQERIIGPGKYEASFVEGVDINDNHVEANFITDATIKRKFGKKVEYEAFFTVNNVFDQRPPFAPVQSGIATYWSNYQLYDPTGRYYTVGLRAKF